MAHPIAAGPVLHTESLKLNYHASMSNLSKNAMSHAFTLTCEKVKEWRRKFQFNEEQRSKTVKERYNWRMNEIKSEPNSERYNWWTQEDETNQMLDK